MTEQLYDIAANAFVDVPLAAPTLEQRKALLKDRVKQIGDTKLTAASPSISAGTMACSICSCATTPTAPTG